MKGAMTELPNFTEADLRELQRLRVTSEQVAKLRISLAWIRALACPASRAVQSDVTGILTDVERLAARLGKRLTALPVGSSVAHRVALVRLLEALYAAGSDEGALDAIAPSLQALAESARAARANVPSTRGRGVTADPRPIERIAEALGIAPSKSTRFVGIAEACYRAAGARDPMRGIEVAMGARRAQRARIRETEAEITRATKRR